MQKKAQQNKKFKFKNCVEKNEFYNKNTWVKKCKIKQQRNCVCNELNCLKNNYEMF